MEIPLHREYQMGKDLDRGCGETQGLDESSWMLTYLAKLQKGTQKYHMSRVHVNVATYSPPKSH